MNALPNLTQKIIRHLFGLTLLVGLASTTYQATAAPLLDGPSRESPWSAIPAAWPGLF